MTNQILFLTDALGGGTGNHLLSMMRYWNTSHWKPEIISSARLSARMVHPVPIHFLTSPGRFNFYPFNQFRSLFEVNRYIRKNPPDIVHAFFFWPIMYGRLLKKLGKIRFLVENREDQGFNWGKHEYTLLRLSRSIPDRVICVSEAVKQVVIRRERIEEDRVAVIRNGVELIQGKTGDKETTRRELGFNDENLIVGMVANFNRPVKGVSYFIEAMPSIIKAVPDVRFLILGRGDQEQELLEKTRVLGIEAFVVFGGFRKDINRFYEIIDISVLTSLSEGLSITLLESMSHGLPVVATNVGGNSELVMDGQTGYLVPPKDTTSIADRIVQLLFDSDLRREMGYEGRQRIEQYFQIQNVADRYLEVYKDLLTFQQ